MRLTRDNRLVLRSTPVPEQPMKQQRVPVSELIGHRPMNRRQHIPFWQARYRHRAAQRNHMRITRSTRNSAHRKLWMRAPLTERMIGRAAREFMRERQLLAPVGPPNARPWMIPPMKESA